MMKIFKYVVKDCIPACFGIRTETMEYIYWIDTGETFTVERDGFADDYYDLENSSSLELLLATGKHPEQIIKEYKGK